MATPATATARSARLPVFAHNLALAAGEGVVSDTQPYLELLSACNGAPSLVHRTLGAGLPAVSHVNKATVPTINV